MEECKLHPGSYFSYEVVNVQGVKIHTLISVPAEYSVVIIS